MPTNLIIKYSNHLDINNLSPDKKIISLKMIFDRDISENSNFNFRSKIIRPLKKEGIFDVEMLFKHLTHQTEEERGENGEKIKKRTVFDIDRSKRLHWIWHHIQEKTNSNIEVFSYQERINSKNIIRTYIYDIGEKYIIILEPQRSQLDYYLITAYHLTEKMGGVRNINRKLNNRLPLVY
jgi:hypothetical protein